MCNHYRLEHTAEQLREALGIARSGFKGTLPAEFFPGSSVPVVRSEASDRVLADATWGIQLGRHRVTNSRDDKLSTWKRFMGRRLVFPMTYAVEWRYPLDMFGQPSGKPTRWKLYPAGDTVGLVAGIADADGGVSMMTTRATGIAAEVHNKHPDDPRIVVFLTESADVDRWLDPVVKANDVLDLLRPAPDGWLAGEPLGATRSNT